MNEKKLFSSLLAGVNAQTPRHAKMKKILTHIIKRACKHFNIDPKDLCDDPDSSAQSKSSSREPAEGDENVDWLALDTTERCTKKKRMMMSGEGVVTRSRKRKVGQRDSLWDLIVNNDDICFTHILPRLDLNDVKFLYEVNSETRKLVKRSSRERDLKKTFDIDEITSISTLEVAWERYPWGKYDHWKEEFMDEPYFCEEVARTNKLELLKWAREEKQCKWDDRTIIAAAGEGNLEMVKYCVANECPVDEDTCESAARNGQLECLKYLREEVEALWDSRTASWAAFNDHLHILEYLVERKYDLFVERACENAAMCGYLDCLKYLHETAKAPWDSCALQVAHESNNPECLQYLLDNDCSLPDGYRYEDGELYVNGELYVPEPESESELE